MSLVLVSPGYLCGDLYYQEPDNRVTNYNKIGEVKYLNGMTIYVGYVGSTYSGRELINKLETVGHIPEIEQIEAWWKEIAKETSENDGHPEAIICTAMWKYHATTSGELIPINEEFFAIGYAPAVMFAYGFYEASELKGIETLKGIFEHASRYCDYVTSEFMYLPLE